MKNFGRSLVKFNIISKLKEVRKVLQRYQDLLAINVFTIHKSESQDNNDTIVAKTIIELDADIITIIPEKLLIEDQLDISLRLHKANVCLANNIFLYPIIRIFVIFKIIKHISLIPAPIWIITYIILYPTSIMSYQIYDYIYLALSSIGVPSLLFKFISKMIGYVIRQKLMLIK